MGGSWGGIVAEGRGEVGEEGTKVNRSTGITGAEAEEIDVFAGTRAGTRTAAGGGAAMERGCNGGSDEGGELNDDKGSTEVSAKATHVGSETVRTVGDERTATVDWDGGKTKTGADALEGGKGAGEETRDEEICGICAGAA